MRKLPHQLQAEPHKFILLDQFIQVDGEELERDARVGTEGEVVEHVYNVHGIILVLFP